MADADVDQAPTANGSASQPPSAGPTPRTPGNRPGSGAAPTATDSAAPPLDFENVSRGIGQLDSMMNNLTRRKEEVTKQLDADKEEVSWIDHSIGNLQPKLDAIRKSLAYKQAIRAELEKTIGSEVKSVTDIAKESADAARRALQKGRALGRKEASNRLELQRGFSTRVHTTDILAGRRPNTAATDK
ncbi:hypothetical protein PPROV_000653700 [Pycnococcus provasolii]|uniref:Uncharacterized protein n=1 Tax=Pycnococcus provasolii TaxID=41880 RepID=A0A830HMF0_9CHLO|nr:hypothetical protein PPROV_000653700 [Pycnococcus provasolii]